MRRSGWASAKGIFIFIDSLGHDGGFWGGIRQGSLLAASLIHFRSWLKLRVAAESDRTVAPVRPVARDWEAARISPRPRNTPLIRRE
jgi:hypothetical protein